jgi:oxygen-dependent protoporphyrinogen oxidase
VQRWQGGTPLYRVGHREWLSHVHAACAAAPGLWLAGAPYDGVGIPDCVRQARTTAAAVATHLSAA